LITEKKNQGKGLLPLNKKTREIDTLTTGKVSGDYFVTP